MRKRQVKLRMNSQMSEDASQTWANKNEWGVGGGSGV